MDPETVLRRSLDDLAKTVDPDVDLLWARVHQRTAGSAPTAPTAPTALTGRARVAASRRRVLVPAAAALVVAALAGGVALGSLQQGEGDAPASGDDLPSGPVEAPVGPEWSCPHRTTFPAPDGSDPVTASLRAVVEVDRVPAEAVDFGVERYQLVLADDTGELRYGDASGRLHGVVALRRVDGAWTAGERTLCSGSDGSVSPDVPGTRQLGVHVPLGAPPSAAEGEWGTPLLVDARSYYDQVGHLRTYTHWVRPRTRCGADAQPCVVLYGLSSGAEPASASVGGASLGRPDCNQPVVDAFYVPLAVLGRPSQAFPSLCSAYVAGDGAVSAVLELLDGRTTQMRRFRGPDWPGTSFAALADSEARAVTVTFDDGRTRTWRLS
jgi:hypothetical protein